MKEKINLGYSKKDSILDKLFGWFFQLFEEEDPVCNIETFLHEIDNEIKSAKKYIKEYIKKDIQVEGGLILTISPGLDKEQAFSIAEERTNNDKMKTLFAAYNLIEESKKKIHEKANECFEQELKEISKIIHQRFEQEQKEIQEIINNCFEQELKEICEIIDKRFEESTEVSYKFKDECF